MYNCKWSFSTFLHIRGQTYEYVWSCGCEKKVASRKAAQRLQQIRHSNLSNEPCSLTRLKLKIFWSNLLMCREEKNVKNAPVWKVTLRLRCGARPIARWHLKVSPAFFKSEFVKCVFPSIFCFFDNWAAAPSSCRPGVQRCEHKRGLTSTKLSTYKRVQHKSCFYSWSFKKKTERQYPHWKLQKEQCCPLK